MINTPNCPLHPADRPTQSLRRSVSLLSAIALLSAPLAQGVAGLPAEINLFDLLPAGGGDGSVGSVIFGRGTGATGEEAVVIGDINNDGLDDFALGASTATALGVPAAGEAYILFGRAGGYPAASSVAALLPASGGDGSAGFVVTGIRNSDLLGREISGIGDVNADGIDDLLIGAPNATVRQEPFAGEAYVIYGRDTDFPAILPALSLLPAAGGDGSAGFVITGAGLDDAFVGSSVSGAGDLNGDGIADLAVAAPQADGGGRNASGEVYVLYGRVGGFPPVIVASQLREGGPLSGTDGFVIRGVAELNFLADAISAVGDFNGDGVDDIVMGATLGGEVVDGPGQAYLVFGQLGGLPPVVDLLSLLPSAGGDGTQGIVFEGVENLDDLGAAVAAADVNGDGRSDLILGAPEADSPAGQTGVAYVVFGTDRDLGAVFDLASLLGANGGNGSQGFAILGIDVEELAGSAVGNAGDVNGDGIVDIIIGANFAPANGVTGAGRSYVVYGRAGPVRPEFPLADLLIANGGDGSQGVVLNGINGQDRSGFQVSGAGDINGDGVDDVVLGSRPLFAEGAGYVIFGDATP